jgi:hypothetical protein
MPTSSDKYKEAEARLPDEFKPVFQRFVEEYEHADGMRLALAFASARYLTRPAQRRTFRSGLIELPAEVMLYWFTLCFYGYRQQTGRAALRTLLTYQQPDEKPEPATQRGRTVKAAAGGPTPFDMNGNNGSTDQETKRKARQRARK